MEPGTKTGVSIVFDLVREFFRISDQSVRNGMRQMSDSKRMGISADTFNKHCEVRLRDKLKQRTGMPYTTCKEGSPMRIITAQKVRPPVNVIRLRIIVEQQFR
ncbi:conserved hypothetical protein [Mesorhizobium escarrei]|uniref:Uncharacterized protein n=1 Tax=Mesorhizobium escarrei TaxID=666018 RepID=A0ABM9DNA8_9HYPH|nr:conserved hypothetical protein [Mesorhizobium escarrei]